MIHVGFTGTQGGMTQDQADTLEMYLATYIPPEREASFTFHHGDCVGADAQAHDLVRARFPKAGIELHPGYPKNRPYDTAKRAGTVGDVKRTARPFLDRNQDIVNASEVIVAAPSGAVEKQRSGTWATVRRARKKGCGLVVIAPDGEIIERR